MSDKKLVIRIDLDERCSRCNKPGAMNGGICMRCFSKALKAGEFDHILKPLQDRTRAALRKEKR
jgi:hypothetical protein